MSTKRNKKEQLGGRKTRTVNYGECKGVLLGKIKACDICFCFSHMATLDAKAIKTRKYRYITFLIDKDFKITPDVFGERKTTYKEYLHYVADMCSFVACLPDTEPRYTMYDMEFLSKDGRPTSKLFFIFWKPDNCNQVSKVTYAQALKTLQGGCHAFNPADSLSGYENKSFSDTDEIEELLKGEDLSAGKK